MGDNIGKEVAVRLWSCCLNINNQGLCSGRIQIINWILSCSVLSPERHPWVCQEAEQRHLENYCCQEQRHCRAVCLWAGSCFLFLEEFSPWWTRLNLKWYGAVQTKHKWNSTEAVKSCLMWPAKPCPIPVLGQETGIALSSAAYLRWDPFPLDRTQKQLWCLDLPWMSRGEEPHCRGCATKSYANQPYPDMMFIGMFCYNDGHLYKARWTNCRNWHIKWIEGEVDLIYMINNHLAFFC